MSFDKSYNQSQFNGSLVELIDKAEYILKARQLAAREQELGTIRRFASDRIGSKDLRDEVLKLLDDQTRKCQPVDSAPNYLSCSITLVAPLYAKDLFKDPVICSSGFTYDRDMILSSIKSNGGIDPNCRKPIGSDPIVPNRAVVEAVREFKAANCVNTDGSNISDPRAIKF